MSTPSPVLELEGVAAGYPKQDRPALSDLFLKVLYGEIIGVTGVSGAGKTTLLRTCAGLLAPLEGRMTFASGDAQRLAYCPQDDVLLDYRNVWENAGLLLERNRAMRLPWPPTKARLEAALERVGLLSRRRQMPSELSGGMRQRLQVIQALCAAEELLLLDEPFAQQDRGNQRRLEDLVFEAARSSRTAVLIVSHDIDALSAICGRVLFLGGAPGRVVAEIETPPELAVVGGETRRSQPGFAALSGQLWAERARAALA